MLVEIYLTTANPPEMYTNGVIQDANGVEVAANVRATVAQGAPIVDLRNGKYAYIFNASCSGSLTVACKNPTTGTVLGGPKAFNTTALQLGRVFNFKVP